MIKYFLGVLSGLLLFALTLGQITIEEKVYDCRLSEISPDFPPKVRDECRKIRLEKNNKLFEYDI